MAGYAEGAWRAGLERVPTNIAGLDVVLAGGLVRGGIYLVLGAPGTGKTTLGNQLAFNHARAGNVSLFATVLAETHGRMLAHLSGFTFFDPELVARGIRYINIYDELRGGGLTSTLNLLRRSVREHGATLLVIDGAALLESFAASLLDYHVFIYELHTQMSAVGCTTVLLSDNQGGEVHPLGTHVDGILVLRDERVRPRRLRLLEAVKIRGVNYLRGEHEFAITQRGVDVYPRLEAVLEMATPTAGEQRQRLPFGVPGLDQMLRGGLLASSTTLILGQPGAGKTISGLHFVVEGARRGERGLIVSFHETPPRLIGKAEMVGLDLGRQLERGQVRILWQPPVEVLLDAWTWEVLDAVAEHRPQRLFLDGITDVMRLAYPPERLSAYLAAFSNELRARNVTTLFSAEINAVASATLDIPVPALSATAENAILLRYVERGAQLRRLISILKLRESDYDTAFREFFITEGGIQVGDPFE